jgi:MFS family permease
MDEQVRARKLVMGSTTTSGSMRRIAYWSLALLFAMNLLNYIDRYILAAVIGDVQVALEIEDADDLAGFLSTAFFISYSLFSPVMGWFGDRLPRRHLLAAGVGVWSVATFWSGWVRSFPEMLLARSLLGIGEATYATIAPTLIADLFPRAQRNRALAVFYVAVPLGAALGYVTGEQVSALFRDWRYAFYVVGGPGLLVAFAAYFMREPVRGASEEGADDPSLHREALPLKWSVYADLFRNRSYIYNTLGMAMMTFAVGGLAFWAPKFIARERGLADKAATYMGIAVFIGGLVGTALGGWVADWLTGKIRGAYFWLCGLTMIAAAPFIFWSLVARDTPVIFSTMAVGLILVFVSTGPSNAIIVNVTVPRIRAAAFAINILMIHILGDIPSPPFMGLVTRLSKDMFFGLAVTLPALLLSGAFYCLGARYLEADQERALQKFRAGQG